MLPKDVTSWEGFGVMRERESQQSTVNKSERKSGGPTYVRGGKGDLPPRDARRES